MNAKVLSPYVVGFVAGVVLTIIVALWGETTMAYRITLIGLLGLVALSAWSKPNPDKRNDDANNNPLYALMNESGNKGSDDATKSQG